MNKIQEWAQLNCVNLNVETLDYVERVIVTFNDKHTFIGEMDLCSDEYKVKLYDLVNHGR